MTDIILFGGNADPKYDYLSNFHVVTRPIVFYGHSFWHSEGIYQWLKNAYDAELLEACLQKDPRPSKRAGRRTSLRPDWEQVKVEVMTQACLAKFGQNPELFGLLHGTGNAVLHENRRDPEWGGGPNFPYGKDLLGKVLMDVRSRLRTSIMYIRT